MFVLEIPRVVIILNIGSHSATACFSKIKSFLCHVKNHVQNIRIMYTVQVSYKLLLDVGNPIILIAREFQCLLLYFSSFLDFLVEFRNIVPLMWPR